MNDSTGSIDYGPNTGEENAQKKRQDGSSDGSSFEEGTTGTPSDSQAFDDQMEQDDDLIG